MAPQEVISLKKSDLVEVFNDVLKKHIVPNSIRTFDDRLKSMESKINSINDSLKSFEDRFIKALEKNNDDLVNLRCEAILNENKKLKKELQDIHSKQNRTSRDSNVDGPNSEFLLAGSSLVGQIQRNGPLYPGLQSSVKTLEQKTIDGLEGYLRSTDVKPKMLGVFVGGNDVENENEWKKPTEKLTKVLKEYEGKNPNTKISVVEITQRLDRETRHPKVNFNRNIQEFNNEMKKTCEANNWTFVNNKVNDQDLWDGTHYNRVGNCKVFSNIKKSLDEIILADGPKIEYRKRYGYNRNDGNGGRRFRGRRY